MRLAEQSERELERLYDDLARFQWWRRRLTRAEPGRGLEMHKALATRAGDGPEQGTSGLHEWLWDKLAPAADVRALDLGCGFGATLFSLAERASSAALEGLSLSGYQVRVATEEAERLGLGARVRFRHESFDAPRPESAFDLLLSIETLFHAPDLAASLPRFARSLDAGGRLVLVEDMAGDASVAECEDARELLRLWSTRRFYTLEDYTRALASAGLELEQTFDLTAQVRSRSADDLSASSRRLEGLRPWLPMPGLKRMVDAFRGGLCLERLYGAGRMHYRCLIARARHD